MIAKGKLRGEKIAYKDGVGCCVWYPFTAASDSDESTGMCFDFSATDITDFIALL